MRCITHFDEYLSRKTAKTVPKMNTQNIPPQLRQWWGQWCSGHFQALKWLAMGLNCLIMAYLVSVDHFGAIGGQNLRYHRNMYKRPKFLVIGPNKLYNKHDVLESRLEVIEGHWRPTGNFDQNLLIWAKKSLFDGYLVKDRRFFGQRSKVIWQIGL